MGALAAFYYGSVVPSNFTLTYSILIVSVVVLGGIGNLWGTVIGAVVLGALEPLLREFVGDTAIPWQAVIYGAALVVMMRLRPEGLLPGGRRARVLSAAGASPAPLRRPERGRGARPLAARSDDDATDEAGSPPIVQVTNLQKSFGGLKAVNGATFSLPRGQITALIGPNGAGKTTIFNMICGTIVADEGQVHLRGEDVTGKPAYSLVGRGLARSFQDVRVCQRLSALDNVAMAVQDQPGERVSRLLLTPLAVRRAERRGHCQGTRLPGAARHRRAVPTSRSATCPTATRSWWPSRGCWRRSATCSCSTSPPAGSIPASVEKVISGIGRLRDLGHTVCLVEHSVHFVQRLADRAVFLDQGTVIAEGTVDDLMGRRELAELYFGT